MHQFGGAADVFIDEHDKGVMDDLTHDGRVDVQGTEGEVATRGEPTPIAAGSEEEFIAQHYWGYSVQKDGGTVEYRVEHPLWRVWQARSCRLDCDVEEFYGKQFTRALSVAPSSAFLAEGSEVTVYHGKRIE